MRGYKGRDYKALSDEAVLHQVRTGVSILLTIRINTILYASPSARGLYYFQN